MPWTTGMSALREKLEPLARKYRSYKQLAFSLIILGEIIDQIGRRCCGSTQGKAQHWPFRLVPLIELIHTVLSHPVKSFGTIAPSAKPVRTSHQPNKLSLSLSLPSLVVTGFFLGDGFTFLTLGTHWCAVLSSSFFSFFFSLLLPCCFPLDFQLFHLTINNSEASLLYRLSGNLRW